MAELFYFTSGKAASHFMESELDFMALNVRSCRACGCTQDDCSACIARTGTPCHWVERDLCSACVDLGEPS